MVPHSIKSIRTKQLTGIIAKDGYDAVEANSNGVVPQEKRVVTEKPVVTGKAVVTGKTRQTFQEAFAAKLNCDLEIGEWRHLPVSPTIISMLITFRSIHAGKRGCECNEEPTVVGKKRKIYCSGSKKPIVDEHGN